MKFSTPCHPPLPGTRTYQVRPAVRCTASPYASGIHGASRLDRSPLVALEEAPEEPIYSSGPETYRPGRKLSDPDYRWAPPEPPPKPPIGNGQLKAKARMPTPFFTRYPRDQGTFATRLCFPGAVHARVQGTLRYSRARFSDSSRARPHRKHSTGSITHYGTPGGPGNERKNMAASTVVYVNRARRSGCHHTAP